MAKEIWYDVEGWEGCYQWSSKFRFRSVDRNIKNGKSHSRTGKGAILSIGLAGAGYPRVTFWKDNNQHHVYVHVFFAKHYVPNPENKKTVNHKDGDKTNYHPSNLEWATQAENNQHAIDMGLRVPLRGEKHQYFGIKKELHPSFGRKGKLSGKSKPVLDFETGIFYDSAGEVAEAKCMNYPVVTWRLRKNTFSIRYV